MPRTPTKKPDPSTILIARDSWCGILDNGEPYTVSMGSRYRADHPVVGRVPSSWWQEDGEGVLLPAPRPMAQREAPPPRPTGPPAKRYKVKKNWQSARAVSPSGAPFVAFLEAGDVVAETNPVVKMMPQKIRDELLEPIDD